MNGQSAHNAALASSGAHDREPDAAAKVVELEAAALAQLARSEYAARRRRDRHLDPALLGEPAWDILLDLFINAVEDRAVSVTSAAIASQAPQTTALRYFATLEAAALIVRRKSSTDARVTYLELTDQGHRRMVSCLRERATSTRS